MLFVIRFTDNPDNLEIRAQYFTAHLSWLDERRQSVLVAENKSIADEFYKTDPFWTNGLRESVDIPHWSKAFPNEQVLI